VNSYQQVQLDALGDATRRAILAQLMEGPKPVGELAQGFSITRPAISQHLRILKDAKLVSDRTRGTRHFYELNSEGFDSLRSYLDQFWTIALDAFKRKVEEAEAKPS
jgi:DNA-binding transcriptional ArsR family regulator